MLPALINGSGSPVGGILPVTTAIFKITWTLITQAIPATSKLANLSLEFNEILISAPTKTAKIITIIDAPKKPNSSQIIENIKSN